MVDELRFRPFESGGGGLQSLLLFYIQFRSQPGIHLNIPAKAETSRRSLVDCAAKRF
jgi:hypothetical protein